MFSNDKYLYSIFKVIHIFQKSKKKNAYISNFIKISVKKIKIKSFIKKKEIFKSIITYTKKFSQKNDSSKIKFKINSCILLKKRLNTISKNIFGPGLYIYRRKKFLYNFIKII